MLQEKNCPAQVKDKATGRRIDSGARAEKRRRGKKKEGTR